jgi:lambda repressor-like predicted transcriptional regulator
MRSRCGNPNNVSYHDYGGRGISVCDRWQQSFENFRDDMLPAWQPGLTLGRKNNDSNYFLENCRWETPKQQAWNKRNNRIIDTPLGTIPLPEAAERGGVKAETLRDRVRRGWPVDRLFNPVPAPRFFGLTMADAARRSGLSPDTLRHRVKRGWPEDRLLAPVVGVAMSRHT